MSRGILSLPGIDHDGPRVLECGLSRGLAGSVSFKAGFDTRGDVLVENVDKNAAFNIFAESAHRFIAAEDTSSELEKVIDPEQVAEWIAKLKSAVEKPIPTIDHHVDPKIDVGSESNSAADIVSAVDLEKRLTKLEVIIGQSSCRSDRVLQQSVDATLTATAAHFRGVSTSGEDFRTIQELLTKIDRIRDRIIARKSEYDSCTASSISAKVSILYEVVLSLSSISSQAPLVVERLSRLRSITDNISSTEQFVEDHKKHSQKELSSDDKIFEETKETIKTLHQQVATDTDEATKGMEETSKLMAELAAKMAEIGVTL